jgi:hypothetical protein
MWSIFALLVTLTAHALDTGSPAPDFTLQTASGKEFKLSDARMEVVVLEWLNHGCPFVRKHYDSGNMQKLQNTWGAKKVKWYSVISSAPGKQGHVDTKGALDDKAKNKSAAADILLDPEGKVGMMYGAKTTPHMFIINKGVLAYQGAIDDKPSADPADIADARNYVNDALGGVVDGQKMKFAETTKAYGCGVKY